MNTLQDFCITPFCLKLALHKGDCDPIEQKKQARLAKRREARKARDEAYRDCGLVKVRGALGGTYWE